MNLAWVLQCIETWLEFDIVVERDCFKVENDVVIDERVRVQSAIFDDTPRVENSDLDCAHGPDVKID